ncbi:MAG: sulfite exporter TauE/SafE family protein [Bacteroidota bacterium]|nr:sulfite exporter TauE/SafE family protein [Bacteroidota bacterium]
MILKDYQLLFPLALMLVAFLYASIGHGGASGYLAIMALFDISPENMRSSVLILNLLVSLISFINYWHKGYFRWKVFWVFAISSIPAAFFGAMLPLHENIYKQLLGICLLFSIFRLIGFGKKKDFEEIHDPRLLQGIIVGGIIGLLSGMIGIGGGVLLSPVILLFHWGNMKETAAVSALFIFVNSLAGISGIATQGFHLNNEIWLWLAVVFIGAILGGFLGSKKFNFTILKYILAVVLSIASVKLLFV